MDYTDALAQVQVATPDACAEHRGNKEKMLHSDYRRLTEVTLPPFQARQKYMHTFQLANPEMPNGFEDYLEPVKQLCCAAGAYSGLAHMTVDEKIVKAGMSQRRPKPHVDGCYMPDLGNWSNPQQWKHYCNNVPLKFVTRMSVIVVASVSGCRAWRGQFEGQPKVDGDLTHIDSQLGEGTILPPNVGFLLSPDCVHESMLFERNTLRTFLRIALPVDFKFNSQS